MVAIEAAKKAEPGELPFNNDVPVERQVYMWQDKYRPRKPRYFNRIHTGFDWNKYNQTHYDHDNPPPKTVQGYKFNVCRSTGSSGHGCGSDLGHMPARSVCAVPADILPGPHRQDGRAHLQDPAGSG